VKWRKVQVWKEGKREVVGEDGEVGKERVVPVWEGSVEGKSSVTNKIEAATIAVRTKGRRWFDFTFTQQERWRRRIV
jgi:hypothetical protein